VFLKLPFQGKGGQKI